MEEMELKAVLRKSKTLRQVLNPSNTEAFVKWAMEIIPRVTQQAIELSRENERLSRELERMRVAASQKTMSPPWPGKQSKTPEG